MGACDLRRGALCGHARLWAIMAAALSEVGSAKGLFWTPDQVETGFASRSPACKWHEQVQVLTRLNLGLEGQVRAIVKIV